MKYVLSAIILIIFIGISAWDTSPVHGADASVTDCTNFAGANTISDAVTAANTGGGTITFSSTLTITDTVIINANGNTVIFEGGDSTSFFAVNVGAFLTINGFTLQNGSSATGGAINNAGTLSVTNSTFFDNNATNQGGAIYNSAAATINNNTFTGNGALLSGGAIYNTSTISLNNNVFQNNLSVFPGEAIEIASGTATSQDNHFENNDCNGTITDNGGNTAINAMGCPNSPLSALSATAVCVGTDLHINILAGDPSYTVFADSGTLLITVIGGSYVIAGPGIWTNLIVRELMGDMQDLNLGDFDCTTPTATPTVLGCALDTTDGLDIFNAPDNTYCRVLMKNGGVTDFSGAIPAQLINLGVILAVDVYRLEGGMSINTFPNYARVCLAGQGRLFYMDGRGAPRVAIELATETSGNLTCGWIPAPGTLILTN